MLVPKLNNYGANNAIKGGLLAVPRNVPVNTVIYTCTDPSLNRQPSQAMSRWVCCVKYLEPWGRFLLNQ